MYRIFLTLIPIALAILPVFARSNVNQTGLDSVRHLDSLNVYHRPDIRVDQLGYRPGDPAQWAWVANASSKTYEVLACPTAPAC
jgi:hypothetical protein